MKRRVPGLHGASQSDSGLEGIFLVRVERISYRWHPQKPFFVVCLNVILPVGLTGRTISGRLYSTPRAMWKLNWFLRDFGYDTDLLDRDEVDEKALLGLRGIVHVSHTRLNGRSFLNFERFAPASDWEDVSVRPIVPQVQEASHDL